jgi:3alpha(or 20beta)-hydroxysteroid dehydrogenase
MGKVEGKVALVTGASQGMGAAHARRLAAEGAKVILTDVNVGPGKELADEIGESALFLEHDVTSLDDWAKVCREAEAAFGPITILVNNAGIIGTISDTVSMTEDDYLSVIAVNQNSQFYGMKTVIPSMVKAGGGSIVNISSTAGMKVAIGSPNLAYVGSKYASRGMTKFVAVEYGPQGVRVNSIHPGFIMTPMMAAATDETGNGIADLVPLRRIGDPDEVSQLVVFLASDESSYISGMEHVIDGALTAS